MTALACFRILVDANRETTDRLAPLVAKVAGAFLDGRWSWPRRWGQIAPFAFLLTDPRATALDPSELTALSEELHLKLFGAHGAGRISMLAIEGGPDAVTRFAAVEAEVLRQILVDGGSIPGVPGRISEITPQGVRIVSPDHEAGPLQPVAPAAPALRRAAPVEPDGIEASYRAVWCALKQSFIGSGLVARRKGARAFYSTIDGAAEQPGADAPAFDIACLEAAPRALTGSQGLLFLPICFSSTVHRATRESYIDVLEKLPQTQRPRLAAAVYGVPRAPTFAAVAQLKAFLNPYFSFVDLQTADPDFQIDALMMEAVNSVTLSLPDIDEGGRMAAIIRFMGHRDAYHRRRIWPAITNVRSRRELELCIRQRVPFLSGKAVCDHLVAPADPINYAADRLPLHETILMANPRRSAAFV